MTDFKDFSSKLRKYKRMLTLKNLFVSSFLCLIMIGCQACGQDRSPGGVFVIGDSISIMYTQPVQGLLAPKGWTVHRFAPVAGDPNAHNTTYTLQHIDQWASEAKDSKVITWNNGIWDCSDMPTSPQEYASNLQQIGQKLKATGAHVIFFTTTEVLAAPGCAETRNQIAKQVLAPLGIEIADLYSLTHGHIDWHGRDGNQNPMDVHYTAQANQQYIGPFVAAAIEGK